MSRSLCKWRLSIWIKNLLPTARKSIENRSQIGLESEFLSKSLSKSILERFRVDFGSNFGSQMGEVLLLSWASGAFRIPNWIAKAFWTPLGAILEAFWKHFQWIFANFTKHFDQDLKANHVSTDSSGIKNDIDVSGTYCAFLDFKSCWGFCHFEPLMN